MKVYLLNGVPTSLLMEALDKGYNTMRFRELTVQEFEELVRGKVVISTIRHPSTLKAIEPILQQASEVHQKPFISLEEVHEDDTIVVIAPRRLVQRGVEQEVSIDDLVFLEIQFEVQG